MNNNDSFINRGLRENRKTRSCSKRHARKRFLKRNVDSREPRHTSNPLVDSIDVD